MRPYSVAIQANNASLLSAWYCENLGFEIFDKEEFDDYNMKIYYLQQNDFILEIIERKDAPALDKKLSKFGRSQVPGFSKIAFEIDNLDSYINKLKERNTTFLMEKSRKKQKKIQFSMFYDLEGNLIQLIEKVES